jgi:hypothetical protein
MHNPAVQRKPPLRYARPAGADARIIADAGSVG